MAKAERKVFGRLQNTFDPPDLIEIQTQSYRDFLQEDVLPANREEKGLQAIFHEIFPVVSVDGRYTLDFVKYELREPKLDYFQALYEGETYSKPLYATFRFKDKTNVMDDDVFLGDIPVMTEDGAFVINGAERVIVSQLHRSPGISTEKALHANGQTLLSVRIIPDRGSWIEIMFDTNDVLWCFMDQRRRRRKFYATTLLRALGFGSDESILRLFYDARTLDPSKRFTEKELHNILIKEDIVDTDSQVVIARRYDPVTPSMLEQIAAAGISKVEVVDVSFDNGTLIKTLREDAKLGIHNEEDALRDIYKRMRPGDPPTASNAKQMIHKLFFERAHYDLGFVGRHKINKKLGLSGKVPEELRTLHESGIDVIEAIRLLLKIYMGRDTVDDIDHLGNRRIRTAGELLENQCRLGLARTERLIRERMTIHDTSSAGPLTPQRLVNSKTFSSVVTDFFSRSQLSQFMDQTNPLSGLAHRLRGPRRPSLALRPHLPDRDARRPEHRPYILFGHLREDQRVRLHRDSLSRGEERQGHQHGRVPPRRRRGAVRDCAGERAAQPRPHVRREEGDVPLEDRVLRHARRRGPVHGRRADAGDLHRRRPDPVPRA